MIPEVIVVSILLAAVTFGVTVGQVIKYPYDLLMKMFHTFENYLG